MISQIFLTNIYHISVKHSQEDDKIDKRGKKFYYLYIK